VPDNLQYKNVIRKSLDLLSKKEKQKLSFITMLQIISSFLDLLGIAVVGVLGAITVIGFGSGQPGDRVSLFLSFLRLDESSLQTQALTLGLLAASILVLKTILSVWFTRRTLFFLSRRGASISSSLVERVLNLQLVDLQRKNTQDLLYSITTGVNLITMGVLGNAVTMVADFSLLIVMCAGLFILDPVIALGTFFFFGVLGIILYKLMHVRARQLGENAASLSIDSSRSILEVLESYRESVVRGRRYDSAQDIVRFRREISEAYAEMQFMPYIGKYVIEASVVVGGLLICGIQFYLEDAKHAVATLAVFLAAGTRIAPAVLRIQQGAIQMRLNIGASRPTLALIDELHDHVPIQQGKGLPSLNWPDFEPSIVLSNVSLKYPNSSRYAVRDVSLSIDPGEFVALVGPSGAGKTSLADLILGVISPTEGEILIGGLKPLDIISNKPGAMAYVPQNVSVLEGTISENVRFGLKDFIGDTSQLLRSLDAARLDQLVSETPGGVDARVGERGNNLSGGQKQRLGIARALYTNPKLLVLDESTSALDGQVESEITESIANLKGQVTLVMIAHRLSTIMGADKVVYMEEGKVLAVGKFDEVRKQIKDFDSQATLMGL
jgi:ABC-type multidrug transport system fused ATPase/permease subunit